MAKAKSGHDPIPPLEWAAAALGLLLAIALLGTIGREALRVPGKQVPMLVVEGQELVSAEGMHVLEIVVRNDSARTAASVQVEGKLKSGEADAETSSATIDYVPGHSSATGGLIFAKDPRTHRLELRVTGYEIP